MDFLKSVSVQEDITKCIKNFALVIILNIKKNNLIF